MAAHQPGLVQRGVVVGEGGGAEGRQRGEVGRGDVVGGGGEGGETARLQRTHQCSTVLSLVLVAVRPVTIVYFASRRSRLYQ